MTALIIIVLILLFLLCWYIESSFWYIYKSDMRKIEDTLVPLRYKIGDIAMGFLFTAGRWLGVLFMLVILLGSIGLAQDNALFQHKVLWWTLAVILGISILWFLYLRGLIERWKQIKSTPRDKQLFPKIKNNFERSIISISWILCLIIVPYTAMELSHESAQRDELYKTILAGVISATAMLGLLIIYRTRKPDENK